MLNNIIVKNMELKRDWEMQGWRNPLLISQDLRAPKQGAGAALFRHYLIIKVVVGRWCGLAGVWGWETRCGTLFFVPVCTFTSSPHEFLWVQSSLSWLRLFLTPGTDTQSSQEHVFSQPVPQTGCATLVNYLISASSSRKWWWYLPASQEEHLGFIKD